MATRRSRIKAIVNVPARRSKTSEDSENLKINSTPSVCDDSKTESPPSVEKDLNITSSNNKEDIPDSENSSANEILPQSQEKSDVPGSKQSEIQNESDAIVNEKDSNSNNAAATNGGETQNVNLVNDEATLSSEKVIEKEDVQPEVEKPNPDEISADVSSNNTVAIVSPSKGKPLTSPIKQRPRLFARPSPKLVEACGRRRYSSLSRTKTLSESEDEGKTKAAVDDAALSVPESASQSPNSSQNKATKSQEVIATNSQESSGGDAKKNGSRPARQRAKNKENRAGDARRRLWQKMKKGNESGPMDRSRLTMFDYIYYNPVSNPMRSSSESSVSSTTSKDKNSEKRNSVSDAALSEELVDDPDEAGSVSGQQKETDDENGGNGLPAPRVKVGPDGELILDEQSLVIETTGLKEGLKDLANGPALIESSSFTNYATYRKRNKGHEWSDNETLRFYKALNVVGTDFTLMQTLLFNKRSRRDLKNKFKREERRNPSLIEKALRYPGVFSNAEELQSEFSKSEPAENDEEKKKGQKRGRKNTKNGQPPSKKKKGKPWLVDAHVSDGENSEDNSNMSNELVNGAETNEEKSADGGTSITASQVAFSVSSEEVMMASQEIVLTNDESDASESSENGFLTRVLQPTRSGRVPKRRELPQQKKNLANDKSDKPLKKGEKNKKNLHPSDSLETETLETDYEQTLEDPRPTVSIEVRDCHPSSLDVSDVEPGSLVVIATTAPDDPSRKVYEVFMVKPPDSKVHSHMDENLIKEKSEVISSAEGFETCSIDTNIELQT